MRAHVCVCVYACWVFGLIRSWFLSWAVQEKELDLQQPVLVYLPVFIPVASAKFSCFEEIKCLVKIIFFRE